MSNIHGTNNLGGLPIPPFTSPPPPEKLENLPPEKLERLTRALSPSIPPPPTREIYKKLMSALEKKTFWKKVEKTTKLFTEIIVRGGKRFVEIIWIKNAIAGFRHYHQRIKHHISRTLFFLSADSQVKNLIVNTQKMCNQIKHDLNTIPKDDSPDSSLKALIQLNHALEKIQYEISNLNKTPLAKNSHDPHVRMGIAYCTDKFAELQNELERKKRNIINSKIEILKLKEENTESIISKNKEYEKCSTLEKEFIKSYIYEMFRIQLNCEIDNGTDTYHKTLEDQQNLIQGIVERFEKSKSTLNITNEFTEKLIGDFREFEKKLKKEMVIESQPPEVRLAIRNLINTFPLSLNTNQDRLVGLKEMLREDYPRGDIAQPVQRFLDDIGRGMTFVRKDLFKRIDDKVPVPYLDEEFSDEKLKEELQMQGLLAISDLRITDRDRFWQPSLQLVINQTPISNLFSTPILIFNELAKDQLSWEQNGTEYTIQAVPTSLSPVHLEIIRNENHEIESVNVELKGSVNIVKFDKNNSENTGIIAPQAIEGSYKFRMTLDKDNRPVISDFHSGLRGASYLSIGESNQVA